MQVGEDRTSNNLDMEPAPKTLISSDAYTTNDADAYGMEYSIYDRPLTLIFGTGGEANELGKIRRFDRNWDFFSFFMYSPLNIW